MYYIPRDFDRFLKGLSDNTFTFDKYHDRGERKIHSVAELQFESVRLRTFYYFKNERNRAEIADLARKGYFYSRYFDCVICAFCGIKIYQDHNYRQATAHRTFDSCPMSQYNFHGNVPEGKAGSDDPLSNINYMLQEFMSFKVRNVPPQERNIISFHERLKFTRNSNLADYGLRASTFRYFLYYLPPNKKPNAARWAEAGFVCTGFTDIVMCFHCKGGLFNIDVDDDPVMDHVRFYGHCTFIQGYCREREIAINYIPKSISETMFDEGEQSLLMKHPLVKHLISKGFDEIIVRKKIVDYVFRFCCFPSDIKTCISLVQDNNTGPS